ncbi:MAG: hypothetical protein SVK08_06765, partial [Halobacteriota archaeon]|nr:hypothetical protein [Halobacteriota archaeon]
MKRAVFLNLLFIIVLLLSPAVTADSEINNDKIIIYYFFVSECDHCKEVDGILKDFEEEYHITVHQFEIARNSTNRDLFEKFMQAYEVGFRDVPAVFIGSTSLTGREVTTETIESSIINCQGCPDPINLVLEWESSGEESEEISLMLVIGTALVDGVNPCTFAVLILLLGYLLSMRTKRQVVGVGLSFTASVFVTYLLFGLGIIELIQFSSAIELIRDIVIVIAISAGLLNIRDYIRDSATLKVPSFAKGTIGRLGRRAAIPSAILLGFFATLVELPCTGGIYLPVLTLLSQKPSKALFYLSIYNLVYILPLIVIILITYFGMEIEEAEG